jgi:hypothetical protein
MTTLRDKINDLVVAFVEANKELGDEGAGAELVDEICETIIDELFPYITNTLN